MRAALIRAVVDMDYCGGAKYPPRLTEVTPEVVLRICTVRHFPSRVEFVDV
jgi:hypothetical protein